MTVDPAISGAVRGGLSLLLLAAAVHKGRDPAAFRSALAGYALLPERTLGVAAIGLAGAELVTAGALLVPATAAAGALGAAALLALYAGAMASALARGLRDIDCGCAGPASRRPVDEGRVVRNAGLVLLALVAAAPVGARPLVALDAVTIAGGALALVGLVAAADAALDGARLGRALGSAP